ncbi:MAG: peptide ABC transporter substrate-binding protein [Planctomycetes bacterium]|nr:peptide ABC transporter substrate-binding protein [Planctomycetota bacterium]
MRRLLLLCCAAFLLFSLAFALRGEHGGDEKADFTFVSPDDHNFLDPQRMSWLHDLRVAECLYEPLVRFKLPELTVEPAAAAKWEVSPDGLTYTFHIRPEAQWSNGDPVTAGDFIHAWRRAIIPDMAADYSQLFFLIAGAEDFFHWRQEQLNFLQRARFASPGDLQRHIDKMWPDALDHFKETVGISSPDPGTLVVRLVRPTPYFLELTQFSAFAPVHAASVEKATSVRESVGVLETDATYWADPERLVTNGPYLLARRRFKNDLLMTQNPHYWNRAAMRNTSIREVFIADPNMAMLMYKQGRIDWLPEIPTASRLAADLVAQHRPDLVASPWAGTYFYDFNCLPTLEDGTVNPLADARVRRALSMAIDRKTIVERVTRLNQPVARSFIPPGSLPGYEPPVEDGADFKPEEAKRLLAEAGYADGSKLTGLSILFNTGQGHENVAQQIKRSWEEVLGVSVMLEGVEGKAFSQRLKTQHYTIARASWIGDYRDATTFLDKHASGNGNNDSKWASAEYDSLLHQASELTDPAQRLAALRKAESLLLREQPIAPIFHYITLQAYDPAKVEGLYPNIWNFRRLEFVRVK